MMRRFVRLAVCLALAVSMLIAPMSALASSEIKIMKVTVDGARMRSGAGNYEVIGSLKKGDKVLYAGKQVKAFCLVRTTGGKQGYVYKEFLKSYGAVKASQVYYTTSKANLYKKASTSSSRIKKLSKHECVFVYETRGGWAYVKTTSGKGGFMKTSYLAKL